MKLIGCVLVNIRYLLAWIPKPCLVIASSSTEHLHICAACSFLGMPLQRVHCSRRALSAVCGLLRMIVCVKAGSGCTLGRYSSC